MNLSCIQVLLLSAFITNTISANICDQNNCEQMTSETTIRGIKQTFEAIQTYEGEGFLVSRPIGSPRLDYLDPILLLDEFGPVDHKPLAAKGAPFHPHRGFQTVSYILEGEVQHTDSLGNHGILKSGDVQWMVAGSGVIHDEVPTPRFKREGGRMHGFQLWVNLPKSLKMCAPDYQDVRADKIPVVNFEGGSIKVIAGEAFGTKAVIETKVPTQYLDCKLNSKSKLVHQFPNDFNGFVYCYKGSVFVGNDESTVRLTRGHIAVLENNGNAFQAITTEGEASFLFIAGQPLNEPMARRGPFVMNTNAEIRQAFEDYYSGKFVMQKGTMSIQTNYDE